MEFGSLVEDYIFAGFFEAARGIQWRTGSASLIRAYKPVTFFIICLLEFTANIYKISWWNVDKRWTWLDLNQTMSCDITKVRNLEVLRLKGPRRFIFCSYQSKLFTISYSSFVITPKFDIARILDALVTCQVNCKSQVFYDLFFFQLPQERILINRWCQSYDPLYEFLTVVIWKALNFCIGQLICSNKCNILSFAISLFKLEMHIISVLVSGHFIFRHWLIIKLEDSLCKITCCLALLVVLSRIFIWVVAASLTIIGHDCAELSCCRDHKAILLIVDGDIYDVLGARCPSFLERKVCVKELWSGVLVITWGFMSIFGGGTHEALAACAIRIRITIHYISGSRPC